MEHFELKKMKVVLEKLKKEIHYFPEKPGVYQFLNSKEEIIYVGKAKNLKKRVLSYFTKNIDSNKTLVLVKNIAAVKYIVVETEEDALLLENNLIKKNLPRYNVLLKDGKTYPSICITKEPFPRVFKTRNIIKNGSEYFGPYSSNYTIQTLLEFVHQMFPLRTCSYLLSKENINAKKFKVCLQYHIKKCNGGCEGKETEEEYQKHIEAVRKLIRGDANELSKILLEKMKNLASHYQFEKAHELKLKYELLENYKSKSIVSNTILDEIDVFGFDEDDQTYYVNILRITKGSIVQGYTIEYKKRIVEEKADLLASAIVELREKFQSNSKEIIVPFDIGFTFKNITVTLPKIGDKRKLLDLATQNAKLHKLDKWKQSAGLNTEQKGTALLQSLQKTLKLEKIPLNIDCFDNSNIAGSNAVAVCVVYQKGKPAKKEYRKYILKNANGADDYASMAEVVLRRYQRMQNENATLPDLIITDGGIGHMETVRKILEAKLNLYIPILGLSKNEKHTTNEMLFGNPPKEIGIHPTDAVFKFLANMQAEVHRFAISFHRDKRSKQQTDSKLNHIKGLGEKNRTLLIRHFKSVKRIQTASLEELKKIIGNHRASIVYNYFKANLNA